MKCQLLFSLKYIKKKNVCIEYRLLGALRVNTFFIQVKEMGAVISQCGCMAEDIGKIFDAYWYLAQPTVEVPSVWPDSYNTQYNNRTPMEVKFNGTSFQSYMSVSTL